MIVVVRVWATEGVNVQWCEKDVVGEDAKVKIHTHIADLIASWEATAQWSRISDCTWKNNETGDRIELLYITE